MSEELRPFAYPARFLRRVAPTPPACALNVMQNVRRMICEGYACVTVTAVCVCVCACVHVCMRAKGARVRENEKEKC